MKSIEESFSSAEKTAENIQFLCSLSQRRFDCILRAAEILKRKLVAVEQ